MNAACGPHCGYCSRCTRGPKHFRDARPDLTRADFIAVHDGFARAGLPRDYFNYDDIMFLWQQGQTTGQIVNSAIEHAAREQRFAKERA